MDVVALYPSIVRDMAKKAVLEAIARTDITWENVDTTNLTRYVAMTMSREKIERLELSDIIPEPKKTMIFRRDYPHISRKRC